jgi:hypothetical protein
MFGVTFWSDLVELMASMLNDMGLEVKYRVP